MKIFLIIFTITALFHATVFADFYDNISENDFKVEEVEGFSIEKNKNGEIVDIKPIKFKQFYFFTNKLSLSLQEPILRWDQEKLEEIIPDFKVDLKQYKLSRMQYSSTFGYNFKSGRYLVFLFVDISSYHKNNKHFDTVIDNYGLFFQRRILGSSYKVFNSYIGSKIQSSNSMHIIEKEYDIKFIDTYLAEVYNSFVFKFPFIFIKFNIGVNLIYYPFQYRQYYDSIQFSNYLNLFISGNINSKLQVFGEWFVDASTRSQFFKEYNFVKFKYGMIYNINAKSNFVFEFNFEKNKVSGFKVEGLALSFEYKL